MSGTGFAMSPFPMMSLVSGMNGQLYLIPTTPASLDTNHDNGVQILSPHQTLHHNHQQQQEQQQRHIQLIQQQQQEQQQQQQQHQHQQQLHVNSYNVDVGHHGSSNGHARLQPPQPSPTILMPSNPIDSSLATWCPGPTTSFLLSPPSNPTANLKFTNEGRNATLEPLQSPNIQFKSNNNAAASGVFELDLNTLAFSSPTISTEQSHHHSLHFLTRDQESAHLTVHSEATKEKMEERKKEGTTGYTPQQSLQMDVTSSPECQMILSPESDQVQILPCSAGAPMKNDVLSPVVTRPDLLASHTPNLTDINGRPSASPSSSGVETTFLDLGGVQSYQLEHKTDNGPTRKLISSSSQRQRQQQQARSQSTCTFQSRDIVASALISSQVFGEDCAPKANQTSNGSVALTPLTTSPFECFGCGRQYKYENFLKSHLRFCHKNRA